MRRWIVCLVIPALAWSQDFGDTWLKRPVAKKHMEVKEAEKPVQAEAKLVEVTYKSRELRTYYGDDFVAALQETAAEIPVPADAMVTVESAGPLNVHVRQGGQDRAYALTDEQGRAQVALSKSAELYLMGAHTTGYQVTVQGDKERDWTLPPFGLAFKTRELMDVPKEPAAAAFALTGSHFAVLVTDPNIKFDKNPPSLVSHMTIQSGTKQEHLLIFERNGELPEHATIEGYEVPLSMATATTKELGGGKFAFDYVVRGGAATALGLQVKPGEYKVLRKEGVDGKAELPEAGDSVGTLRFKTSPVTLTPMRRADRVCSESALFAPYRTDWTWLRASAVAKELDKPSGWSMQDVAGLAGVLAGLGLGALPQLLKDTGGLKNVVTPVFRDTMTNTVIPDVKVVPVKEYLPNGGTINNFGGLPSNPKEKPKFSVAHEGKDPDAGTVCAKECDDPCENCECEAKCPADKEKTLTIEFKVTTPRKMKVDFPAWTDGAWELPHQEWALEEGESKPTLTLKFHPKKAGVYDRVLTFLNPNNLNQVMLQLPVKGGARQCTQHPFDVHFDPPKEIIACVQDCHGMSMSAEGPGQCHSACECLGNCDADKSVVENVTVTLTNRADREYTLKFVIDETGDFSKGSAREWAQFRIGPKEQGRKVALDVRFTPTREGKSPGNQKIRLKVVNAVGSEINYEPDKIFFNLEGTGRRCHNLIGRQPPPEKNNPVTSIPTGTFGVPIEGTRFTPNAQLPKGVDGSRLMVDVIDVKHGEKRKPEELIPTESSQFAGLILSLTTRPGGRVSTFYIYNKKYPPSGKQAPPEIPTIPTPTTTPGDKTGTPPKTIDIAGSLNDPYRFVDHSGKPFEHYEAVSKGPRGIEDTGLIKLGTEGVMGKSAPVLIGVITPDTGAKIDIVGVDASGNRETLQSFSRHGFAPVGQDVGMAGDVKQVTFEGTGVFPEGEKWFFHTSVLQIVNVQGATVVGPHPTGVEVQMPGGTNPKVVISYKIPEGTPPGTQGFILPEAVKEK